MFDPTTAIIAGTVGSAASGLIGSSMQADALQSGASASTAAQLRMFETARKDLAPWRKAGEAALEQMKSMVIPGYAASRATVGQNAVTAAGTGTRPGSAGGADGALYDRQIAALEREIARTRKQRMGFDLPPDGGNVARLTQQLNSLRLKKLESAGLQQTATGPEQAVSPLSAGMQQTATGPEQAVSPLSAQGSQGEYDFTTDPSYQFRLQEGMKALERSQAARHGTLGGRATKEMIRYGQDYASTEFGKAYERLAQMAGLGSGSASQTAGSAMQTGGTLAQIQQNLAAGQASSYGNMASTVSGAFSSGANNYMLYKMLPPPSAEF